MSTHCLFLTVVAFWWGCASNSLQVLAEEPRAIQAEIVSPSTPLDSPSLLESWRSLAARFVPFPSHDTSFRSFRIRLRALVFQTNRTSPNRTLLQKISEAETRREVHLALEPLLLAGVQINPESRVKIDLYQSKIFVKQHHSQRFLIHIENLAGITAPLRLTSLDTTQAEPDKVEWVDLKVVDDPWSSHYLSGAEEEYKLVEITAKHEGKRELRIMAEAGQGTQDLGFRAIADLLIESQGHQ